VGGLEGVEYFFDVAAKTADWDCWGVKSVMSYVVL
jgi:hypothetical protein